MSSHSEYQAAATKAEAKKASFFTNAQIARERVSPGRLKSDAKAKVKQSLHDGNAKAQDTVREHPVAFAAAGLGLVAYLFRRPLCRLVKGSYGRLKQRARPAPSSFATRLKQKFYEAASAARLTGDLK